VEQKVVLVDRVVLISVSDI